jgi:hypothetical protein
VDLARVATGLARLFLLAAGALEVVKVVPHAHRRGMPDDKLRCEIQTLGCSAGEAQRLVEMIGRETAALVG